MLRALQALAALCVCVCSLAQGTPIDVLWFDLSTAARAESFTYEEQMMAFTFQGIVNREGSDLLPQLMFNASTWNFDWPDSDTYWRGVLSDAGRVSFHDIPDTTLCGLLAGGDPNKVIQGAVAYDPTLVGGTAQEWSAPIAATLAGQQNLLPVTDAMRARFPCLACP